MTECGVCGRALELFGKHGWRHLDAMHLTPHRAVIGTPGPKVRISSKVEAAEAIVIEPEPVERATQVDELDGAAGTMMRLAQRHGWDVLAYRNPSSTGLSCARGRELISMLWVDGFKFAIARVPHAEKLSAAEAKGLLMQDVTCDDCGDQFAAHQDGCSL